MPTLRFSLVLSLAAAAFAWSQDQPYRMEDLAITVTGPSRPVVYTNKEEGVYYTETKGAQTSPWQGWRINSRKVLDRYVIRVDGQQLNPAECVKADVMPHQFRRYYRNGAMETVTLLDSLNAMVIALDSVHPRETAIYPVFSEPRHYDDYTMAFDRNIMLIARAGHDRRTPEDDRPAVLAVSWAGENLWTAGVYDSSIYGRGFSPCYVSTVNPAHSHVAVLVWGDSATQAVRTARMVAKYYDSLITLRRERMERLINDSYLRTSDTRLNTALNWAKLSLDALVMNQMGKGIFAGLPWFDNYWGRDTYISLPGAALVTGRFADAREIFRTFAALADTSPGSPTYGRIPNLVTAGSRAFNTADGTPRFVMALDAYVRSSGDTLLLRELYPLVRRSVEGMLGRDTDTLGFLLHGDAETWMDAAGPGGPWSPRGNRANDIQALWYAELTIASAWASRAGEPGLARSWAASAERLRQSFQKYFIDTSLALIYDHLTSAGTPERTLRPNELFCLAPFVPDGLRAKVLGRATAELVYPHGVGTLPQTDPNFHPYHRYPPFYVPDAAYHNGIVWVWLAGIWIDEAVRAGGSDAAYRITDDMTARILGEGGVGTLPELVDAAPRDSVLHQSGTVSQAWSLAEYIRTFYQDYLGVRPDALQRTLALAPRLPAGIGSVDARIPVGGGGFVRISLTAAREKLRVRLVSRADSLGVALSWRAGDLFTAGVPLRAGDSLDLAAGPASVEGAGDAPLRRAPAPPQVELRFAVPPSAPHVKGPDHRLLSNAEIKKLNPAAGQLADMADPAGDERYQYPLTQSLEHGSLDITRFTVTADRQNLYFRLRFTALSDPGWHPEYGFQLTYAAIAIDRDGKAGSGSTDPGMNARYRIDRKHAFERIIYVGGGIRIDDAAGNVLAEYVPVPGDERNPLGDIESKTISFAVPVELLGKPDAGWRFTVLVGAQDDHGGAGIGEFREVGKVASEWSGGGRERASDPNVYDVILPKP